MEKKKYTPPSLTVVCFHSEHGFALSLPIENSINPLDGYIEMMMFEEQNNNNYRETETFIDHSVWTDYNSDAFWQ